MKRVEEKEMKEGLHDRLQISMFSHHVNRSSLGKRVSQDILFAADYLVQHLCGSLYAALMFALDKDDERLSKAEDLIKKGLGDLQTLRNGFYIMEKDND